ncbi:class I SAM-dependent methyltransferase [Salipaludibacillus agaradhaerens]|uniref:class I SAM-dependent methyltransferase n=1 Tax=Salipaludibacillus agaradhaerens TaxID=76935 RepID=UPI0021517A78|nr:class I SAM-dependent methyltransferase [Salipaludibacillus agaradhaerens]MCR6105908.1 class I SAM-dependent methyltransferase [Salipaludibacillus agaradhaerens]MCR6117941.1 class I SAM-dependent methyltransferase [Salipaludibacillus agaradhaerens]
MGTSWKSSDVTEKFNDYNDMLEDILGFQVLFDEIKESSQVHHILDYGCGPGKVAERLAGLNENYQIVAVDESKGMVDIAKNYRHKENIDYRLIANDNLSFLEDNSMDIVIICFVIINISSEERIRNVIKEIYRVLKPSGKLLILDSNPNAIGYEFSTFRNGVKGKTYKNGDKKQQFLDILNRPDLVLDDYYWTREFYMSVLEEARFSKIGTCEPTIETLTARKVEQAKQKYNVTEWGDEKGQAPFIIFKAKKTDM